MDYAGSAGKVVVAYWRQPDGIYVVAAYKGSIETAVSPLESAVAGRSAAKAKRVAEAMAVDLRTELYEVTIEKC